MSGYQPAAGLRVAHHAHAEKLKHRTGWKKQIEVARSAGWYIEVRADGKWQALLDLKFARERDAVRAVQSLNKAGLHTWARLQKADPIHVLFVACEHLQW